MFFENKKSFIDHFTQYGLEERVAAEALNYPINIHRDLLNTNNCYTYGVGDLFLHGTYQELEQANYAPWIGETSGLRIPAIKQNNVYDLRSDFIDRAQKDGISFVSVETPAIQNSQYVQIFIACDKKGYGHVYKQNLDGLWSHKRHVCAPVSGYTLEYGNNKLIKNPYKSFRMEYIIPIGFFRVPIGTVVGIKTYENYLNTLSYTDNLGQYLKETDWLRKECASMNIAATLIDKVEDATNCPEFYELHGRALQLTNALQKTCAKYKETVNRHLLLNDLVYANSL